VTGGPGSLHERIWEGQIEEVANLLGGGADPNQRDEVGRSPLLIAAIVGSAGITRLLVEAGAHVESQDPSGGATAMMQAVSAGHLEILKALLGAGGDVEAQDASPCLVNRP
jgi:ankyrin repeat protein